MIFQQSRLFLPKRDGSYYGQTHKVLSWDLSNQKIYHSEVNQSLQKSCSKNALFWPPLGLTSKISHTKKAALSKTLFNNKILKFL